MSGLAICAIAKNENIYINEWVSYHINLGFDTIYLYDNNLSSSPYVGDFIEEKYRDRVVIINMRDINMRSKQHLAYNDWLEKYIDENDYCAFIDIDEFIVTDNIPNMLAKMPKDSDFMVLNWQLYSGGDILEGDESVPVRVRFTEKYGTYKNIWNNTLKTIIRCKSQYPIKALNAHGFYYLKKASEEKYCDCNGDYVELLVGKKFARRPFDHQKAYIAHYATKSLSEYLKYKVDKIGNTWNNSKGKISYFFRSNRKTDEKLAYIEKWIKEQQIKSL